MASKMVFSVWPNDCYCRPGLAPCDKIAYQYESSYPSMVQISAFQASDLSAFTVYKKRDTPKGPNTVRLLSDDIKSSFVRWSGDASPFQGQDEENYESPIHHLTYISQSTSDLKEGKSKTQRERPPVVEDTTTRNDKKPKCLFCGKLYARSSTLRIHMRIHLGVKPYRCPYCHKAFTQSGNRTTHMRIHTGAKPYICTRCHKGFAQSSALKSHMLTHS